MGVLTSGVVAVSGAVLVAGATVMWATPAQATAPPTAPARAFGSVTPLDVGDLYPGEDKVVYVRDVSDGVRPLVAATSVGAEPEVLVIDEATGEVRFPARVSPASTTSVRSERPVVSSDGGSFAFDTGQLSAVNEVFVRDLDTWGLDRVSVDATGGDPNAGSTAASLSGDGRYVVFLSAATDLVAGDTTDDTIDVFLRDRQAGVTVKLVGPGADTYRVSRPLISGDGAVVFYTRQLLGTGPFPTTGPPEVVVVDVASGSPEVVTTGAVADVNQDGTVLLLSGDTTVSYDIERYDIASQQRRAVVVDGDGTALPVPQCGDLSVSIDNLAHLSADGRYAAFRWQYVDCDSSESVDEVRVFDAVSGTSAATAGLAVGMGSAGQAYVTRLDDIYRADLAGIAPVSPPSTTRPAIPTAVPAGGTGSGWNGPLGVPAGIAVALAGLVGFAALLAARSASTRRH